MTIDDLEGDDPSSPGEFVLTEVALRDVPERLTNGLEIDPRHIEIAVFPPRQGQEAPWGA